MLIAGLSGFVVVAAGFVALHFARVGKSGELKIAGWVLIVGGVLSVAAFAHFVSNTYRMGGGPMVRMMPGGKMMLEAPPPPGAPRPPQAEDMPRGKKPAKPAEE